MPQYATTQLNCYLPCHETHCTHYCTHCIHCMQSKQSSKSTNTLLFLLNRVSSQLIGHGKGRMRIARDPSTGKFFLTYLATRATTIRFTPLTRGNVFHTDNHASSVPEVKTALLLCFSLFPGPSLYFFLQCSISWHLLKRWWLY